MNLKRVLNSVGKRCFRNCYEVAIKKGEHLVIEDLLANDPKLKGTKESGLRTRLNCIKRIVRENKAEEALIMSQNARK